MWWMNDVITMANLNDVNVVANVAIKLLVLLILSLNVVDICPLVSHVLWCYYGRDTVITANMVDTAMKAMLFICCTC